MDAPQTWETSNVVLKIGQTVFNLFARGHVNPSPVFEADTVADEIIAALGDGPSKGCLAVVEQMQKWRSAFGRPFSSFSIKYKSKIVRLMTDYQ